MGCLLFEEDVEAAGIRNLREVNNAELTLLGYDAGVSYPGGKKL